MRNTIRIVSAFGLSLLVSVTASAQGAFQNPPELVHKKGHLKAVIQLSDGKRAVQLAEQANALASNNNAAILHTLAAAYAEAGRFDEALQTARRAMKLASRADNNAVYNAIRDELPLYELGLPYHENKPPP